LLNRILCFAAVLTSLFFVAACAQAPADLPAARLIVSATAVPTGHRSPGPTPDGPTDPPATIAPLATSTAVPPATLPPPAIDNPRNVEMARSALAAGAEFLWLNRENLGVWRFVPRSFFHPIALEVTADTAYLLDGGRVLRLNLGAPAPPELILQPGDFVADALVTEPLDLAWTAEGLLVLDRVGDVYLYQPDANAWQLERYDRPIGDTSSHYYLALADRVLVEPNYGVALQFMPDQPDRFWHLPEQMRPVDVSTYLSKTYTLLQDTAVLTATVNLYEDTAQIKTFQPQATITQPRQIVATETAVTILDQDGRRLLLLDPVSGDLMQMIQTPPVSTFWTDGQRLILAGQDQLYFVHEPEQWLTVPAGAVFADKAPHDPAFWSGIGPFIVPVQGSQMGRRELQMPGAPRHYRLGIHEGVDFYWSAGTAVRAVADGVVIRAMHDYEEPEEIEFDRRREEVKELGYTSEDSLDFYRGRQVWIEHEDGTIARYVHLSEIEEEILVGTAVAQGQIIGKIGNSGSPASIKGPDEDAHLHFELWLNGHYLGQFLRPIEVRERLTTLFLGP